MNKNHTCAPLIEVAKAGNGSAVAQLLKQDIDVNEQCTCDGKTALHWASEYHGCDNYPPEIATALLRARACVNIRDSADLSPLEYAARHSMSLEIVETMSEDADEDNIVRSYDRAKFGGASTPIRHKIINHLSNKLPLPTSRVDVQECKNIMTAIEELHDKHIKYFYEKSWTEKELGEALQAFREADKNYDLPKFRSAYQGRNGVKPILNKIDKNILKKYDEIVRKYDEEILPAYRIVEYLKLNDEAIDSIKFLPSEENDKGHDVLLTLPNGEKKILDLTRAIDGHQEHLKTQKLRQDGFLFEGCLVTETRAGRYVQNSLEVVEVPYVQILLNAFERKVTTQNKKTISGKNLYDWLGITLKMAAFSEPEFFLKNCKEFYEKIMQRDDMKNENPLFKRIFIFRADEPTKWNLGCESQLREEKNCVSSNNRVWDSANPAHLPTDEAAA